ncbi:MAG: ATP-dependent RNA helicase, partial [Spirochaetales bacterium]|nr:ATP-dependent RNA helicase [Spirochaetales bacterium]
IVVESPTGSGKTTQIPLILKEAGYADNGVIGITQPRRIATLGVCSFIKDQISVEGLPENYCAYKMRFYDTTDNSTRIKILTDGMLLQELKADPLLSRYSVIMVDEAHERSLNIDFILGLLKQITARRPDLKVIISSATLNTKVFSKYFSDPVTHRNAPIISIKARVYDVDVKYFPLKSHGDADECAHAICVVINQLLKRFKATGYKDNEDTLVFLPGEFDIKTTMQQIYYECDHEHLQIYPLYGRLNKEEQEQVFEPTLPGKMKVVLATNIAETSLTIDGIKVVIDSGLAKINYYNQTDFTSSLVLRNISRSSAEQRKGRAGRTAPGRCYRLYSKEEYDARQLWTPEEILRTDLSEVVLRMVDLGIYDFESFPYVTRPDSRALASGERTLRLLNAIDENRHLTSIGQVMVRYPLLPRHSRSLVEALRRFPDMIKPVVICLSFLSGRTPFILPPGEEDMARSAHRRYNSPYGDFMNYQTIYRQYISIGTAKKREDFCKNSYLDIQSMDEIVHITDQLCQITEEMGIPVKDFDVPDAKDTETFAHDLLVCIGAGLLQYVCLKKKTAVYRTITTDEIYIHPGSAWFRNPPQYLLAGEIVMTTKMYARTVSPLHPDWVSEISPKLADRLKKLSKEGTRAREQERPRASRGSAPKEDESKVTRMYGFEFPVIKDIGRKGAKNITVIPSKDLPALAKAYRKSSRHPKSVNATILFNGSYVAYGEKLYDVISLNGRVRFEEDNLIGQPSRDVYYVDTIQELVPYLHQVMKLSPLRENGKLGFIELLSSGGNSTRSNSKLGIFMHVNRSFSEAVNNSAYTLLSLMDLVVLPELRKTYNRILKLLD